MHVDLISTTKAATKVIHGTENSKRTACGINLIKPENIGMYTSVGTMTDVAQMTCEKCKTVIAKKLIKESNKEMAAMMKEEQKMRKKDRSSKHQNDDDMPISRPAQPSPAPSRPTGSSSSAGVGYVPPSMRRQMQAQQAAQPIDAPAPELSQQISVPAPNAGLPPIPQAPIASAAQNDDVLAQFAIPAPSAPAPAVQANGADDVLSQFAIPTPAAPANDDILSQFAIPTPSASAPAVPQQPAAPAMNDDVLAQFAIPSVPTSLPGAVPAMPSPTPEPVMPTPTPAPANDDILAQFAIPSVPTAVPTMPTNRGESVNAANEDDLLAQFSVPSAPPVQNSVEPQPSAPILSTPEDILAQFSAEPVQKPADPLNNLADTLFGESNGTAQSQLTQPSGASTFVVNDSAPVPNSPLSHFTEANEIVDVTPTPVPDGLEAFTVPSVPPVQPAAPSFNDSLDDLLLMPGKSESAPAPTAAPTIANIPSVPTLNVPEAPTLEVPPAPQLSAPIVSPTAPIPDITNVPSAQPAMQAPNVPTLEVPPMPSAVQQPVYPNTPPMPQGYPYPAQQPYPNGYMQQPMGYPNGMQQAFNPFAAPQPQKKTEPEGPTPLFVGYSADGRQLFQTYDAMGNPIPITEPVYSAPPEQPKNGVSVTPAASFPNGSVAPIMDLEDLMASMGIEDPNKPVDDGKVINYSEYHLPDKKKKTTTASKAKAVKPAQPEPTGPISAAEAKRRKKVDKINKDFEKQLRARGIDPKTGGIIMDPKK